MSVIIFQSEPWVKPDKGCLLNPTEGFQSLVFFFFSFLHNSRDWSRGTLSDSPHPLCLCLCPPPPPPCPLGCLYEFFGSHRLLAVFRSASCFVVLLSKPMFAFLSPSSVQIHGCWYFSRQQPSMPTLYWHPLFKCLHF